MSDESTGLTTPNLVGSEAPADTSDRWDDEIDSEASNSDSEPSEPKAEPKAKATPEKAPEAKPAAPKPDPIFEFDGRKLTQAEIKRELEKARGADAKFREAAEHRKQVEDFMEAFQKDPLSILKDKRIPIDRKSLGEKLLLETLEEEMLSPAEREARELKSKLSEYESKEQAAKRQAEEAQNEQKKEIKRQEISQLFSKAMEQTPLSKDPETAAMAMRDMAMMMRAAKERGIEVSAEELAKHAETKYQKAMYALANTLEGEDLIGFLGEDVIKKIRKADLARLKSNNQQTQSHKQEDWEAPKSNGTKKPMDAYAAREHARKMLFGK
jgi:hypothetical protein